MAPTSRRFLFPDPAALRAAYRSLAELPWVESCALDVCEGSLRIGLSPRLDPGEAERRFQALEKQLSG